MRHSLDVLGPSCTEMPGTLPPVFTSPKLPREGAPEKGGTAHLEHCNEALHLVRVFEGLRGRLLRPAEEPAHLLLAIMRPALLFACLVLKHLAHSVAELDLKRAPDASTDCTSDGGAAVAEIRILWVVAPIEDGSPCACVLVRHGIDDKILRGLVGIVMTEKVLTAKGQATVKVQRVR